MSCGKQEGRFARLLFDGPCHYRPSPSCGQNMSHHLDLSYSDKDLCCSQQESTPSRESEASAHCEILQDPSQLNVKLRLSCRQRHQKLSVFQSSFADGNKR